MFICMSEFRLWRLVQMKHLNMLVQFSQVIIILHWQLYYLICFLSDFLIIIVWTITYEQLSVRNCTLSRADVEQEGNLTADFFGEKLPDHSIQLTLLIHFQFCENDQPTPCWGPYCDIC